MDGFKTLQEIGSKTIASDTHIPIANVEKILNKEYETLQKPQFFGFLSILEREYKIDLSPLKQEYLFSRAEEEITQENNFDIAETGTKLFEQKKELLKNKKVLYGVAGALVALLIIILISNLDFSSAKEAKIEINNTAIDKAKKNLNLEPVAVANVEESVANNDVESAEFGQEDQDGADTSEKSTTAATTSVTQEKEKAKEPVSSTEPSMPLYLRIVPKGRLWLGLINGETYRRRVETISKPLILDPEKTWLIVTGYGHLDLDCGDTTTKFREDRKLLLLYEAGICQEIDKEEFKARNRGKLW